MRTRAVIAAGRRRRRLAATLALVFAIAVALGIIILGTQSRAPRGAAGDQNSANTTTVQRRDLVQTDTESGTLSYADPQTVYNRLTGTITWLPSIGQVIRPGQAIYRVNGEPVSLMDGSTPAYRDLNSSDSAGQDILQLNRNLVALGFDPGGVVVDDVWQPATTAAVELFQESLGETETGSLTLGHIVFLPGSRVVSTVDGAVGSNGSGSSSSASDPHARTPPNEYVSLTKTTPTSASPSKARRRHQPRRNPSSAQTIATLRALLDAATAQLRAERAELKAGNGAPGKNGNPPNAGNSGQPNHSGNSENNGNSGNNRNGNPSTNGNGNTPNTGNPGSGTATAILHTTSTQLVVTVDLDATKQSEAKAGQRVTVELPNGNTVSGRISEVSPVAQSSNNSGTSGNSGNIGNNTNNANNGNNAGNGSSGASVPVTIALSGHHSGSGLDQAAVSVNFAQAEANDVLSVPVTALLAIAGGRYAVQQTASPHALIPVSTGLFAAGYVEISGHGVYPGLSVTDSQG
ncbi:MAG: peptidoglycan-binding protein [Solirubrobacterales bacterium]|nr:peptidoglycan-binding protein [Solirubrobacterales bacterium]